GDRLAVDLHSHRSCGTLRSFRGTLVLIIYRKHNSLQKPPGLQCRVLARKSSLKCLSALVTGNGVMPPRPHNEPCNMTSHNSSSWRRLRSVSTPPRIRSITSTPRVEPMRQGVHLPQ